MESKIIDQYKITYSNGFVQYKDLISHVDYLSIYKENYKKILSIETDKSIGKKRKKEMIEVIKNENLNYFGDNFFTNKSPLYDAMYSGKLFLLNGSYKVKVEKFK